MSDVMMGTPTTTTTSTSKAEDKFASLILESIRCPLSIVHPKRANRTLTSWDSAVCVKVDATISSCFQLLIDENILSLPVLDKEGIRCIGFVDMMDLVMFTVNLFSVPMDIELTEFFQKSKRFKEATVADIIDLTNERSIMKPHSIDRDYSLHSAIETLVRTSQHRVAVVKDQKVVGVVTESMAIGWLYVSLDKMSTEAKNTPVSDIKKFYWVTSINENAKAIDAFKLMLDRRVSGIAVVDDKGQLKDSISLRDLKGIGPDAEMFARLYDSVSEFKKKVRKSTPHSRTIPKAVLYVTENDTLETVIRLMEREAVHRLFVVESATNTTPKNVITQSDILRFIMPF